ncbi:GTPase Era [bacterium]|nr:GTPase Era [bacterium]MBR2652278.1 GTPase Era [bacterium]
MKKYVGSISIIGKPNVGKSSLLNKIFNEKISIVNPKPQTTRNKIISNFVNEKYNINFIDTPGFHNEKNKLDEFLNKEVKSALRQSNLIYYLIDCSRLVNEEDKIILELLKKINLPTFLVITKVDLAKENRINEIIKEVTKTISFAKVAMVSIHDSDSIDRLLLQTEQFLDFDEENLSLEVDTIQKDLFLVREIIREQCLISLRQEVPYGIAILIDDFKYLKDKNEFIINASLNVEKESQKKILIGVGGKQIKEISVNSRNELMKIYDSKIYLKIFVKVSKN